MFGYIPFANEPNICQRTVESPVINYEKFVTKSKKQFCFVITRYEKYLSPSLKFEKLCRKKLIHLFYK